MTDPSASPSDEPVYPVIGVGVVVWKNDQFLLIKRGKPPRQGQWSIPGGRQEWGETTRETGIREVREETGLDVEITHFIDVVDSITRADDGEVSFHLTLIDYGAEWRYGDAKADTDADAVGWFTLEDLPDLKLWSETERIIRRSADLRSATSN